MATVMLSTGLFGIANSANAQMTPPEAGRTVDVTVQGAVSTIVPANCMSLNLGTATLVVDRAPYERIAATILDPDASEGDRRRSSWMASEARKFLDAVSGERDSQNCLVHPYTATKRLPYQFEIALHNGSAVVIVNASKLATSSIRARYFATAGFGGHVQYQLLDGTPFHSSVWWIQ